MADEALEMKMQVGVNFGEEDTEKWVKYYSSFHQILLVGDGDFSFSICLAQSFGSASNIVASSLDDRDDVIKKYKKAKSNLDALQKLGACVLHGVDATKMKLHPDLKMRRFDRIIFNFPHAGFHGREDSISLIMKHRNLVLGFLKNATSLLRLNGEIHVNHKTTAPFSDWNIQELGEQSSLTLIECADFNKEDYPDYNNKRGDGFRCDEPFPLGKCSTFKFAYIRRATENKPEIRKLSNLTHYPLRSHVLKMNEGVPPSVISPRINGYPPFFGGYTNNGLEIHGRSVSGSVCSFNYDFQRSMLAWPSSSNFGNTDMVPLSVGARARNELYQFEGASYDLQGMRLEPEYFEPYSVETYLERRLRFRLISVGRSGDVEANLERRLRSRLIQT